MTTDRRRLVALFAGALVAPKLARAANAEAPMNRITAYAFSFDGTPIMISPRSWKRL